MRTKESALAEAYKILSVDLNVKSVVIVLEPRVSVKVTRRFKPTSKDKRREFVVTIGTPDYYTAALIRSRKKHRLSAEIKRLVMYPKSKKV